MFPSCSPCGPNRGSGGRSPEARPTRTAARDWRPHNVARGLYQLVFDTAAYFRAWNVEGFYPEVDIVFEVRDPSQAYHVPLLLSPYAYSTYRGT